MTENRSAKMNHQSVNLVRSCWKYCQVCQFMLMLSKSSFLIKLQQNLDQMNWSSSQMRQQTQQDYASRLSKHHMLLCYLRVEFALSLLQPLFPQIISENALLDHFITNQQIDCQTIKYAIIKNMIIHKYLELFISITMILTIGISLLILLLIYTWIKFYYTPNKQLKRYISLLQQIGYKVYQRPFKFLGLSILHDTANGVKNHNDALYYEKMIHTEFDIILGNAFDRVTFSIVKPELMRHFLSAQMIGKYPKIQMLLSGVKEMIGGGMFFAEGELWKNKRKIMSKLFSFELLKANIYKIASISDHCFQQFDKAYQIDDNLVKYNMMNLTSKTFNAVMMQCFFGHHQIKEKIDGKPFQLFVISILQEVSSLCVSPIVLILGKQAFRIGLTSAIRQINRKIRLFKEKCRQIIKIRTEQVLCRQRPQSYSDILQALIWQKHNNPKQDFSYSDDDLISEFITFLFGGTDTTSRFFTMLVYYISNSSLVQENVKKQINQIIKDDKNITNDHLKKLVYLQSVINEAIRLYNPTVFPLRIATQDHFLNDIPIKKGVIVTIQPISNHYNQTNFKNSFEFKPERWDKQSSELHPYAFLAFSGGPRSCIGKQLALIQTKIIMIKMFKRYQRIYPYEQKIRFNYDFLYDFTPFETTFAKKT